MFSGMPPRILAILAVAVLTHVGLSAQSDAPATTPEDTTEQQSNEAAGDGESSPGADRQVFSDEKYSHLFEKHAPPEPEDPDASAEVETLDEVVELEAYVVEGDGGLMMARFRRRWDLGTESIQRRVAELNEDLGKEIQFSAMQHERFFSEQSYGSVRDRPQTVPVTGEDMMSIGKTIFDAVGSLRNGGK